MTAAKYTEYPDKNNRDGMERPDASARASPHSDAHAAPSRSDTEELTAPGSAHAYPQKSPAQLPDRSRDLFW